MRFYNLRLYTLQHLVKLEGRVYVPDSKAASQALYKHRLNAGIAGEFGAFPFVFLCASAYEPTSKFLVVEIRCERGNVPLYTSHAKAGDNPRDSNRRWDRCHGKLD